MTSIMVRVQGPQSDVGLEAGVTNRQVVALRRQADLC